MAVARDTDLFFASASFPSSPTTQAFTVGAGSNRYMLVWFNWLRNGTEITSTKPTYAGVNLTHLANYVHAGGPYGSLWELKAPTTGANNLVVTHSGVTFSCFIGSYNGVDQVTPLGTISSDIAFSGTSVSLSPASAVGDLVVRFMNKNAGTALAATGTGATLRQSGNDADLDGIAGYADQTAAAGTTAGGFSWTTNAAGVLVSAAVKAASAGGGSPSDALWNRAYPRRDQQRSRLAGFDVVLAGVTVDGTGAATFGVFTSAGTGDQVFAGSGAASFGAITAAGAGDQVFAGTGAATFGAFAAAGNGDLLPIHATLGLQPTHYSLQRSRFQGFDVVLAVDTSVSGSGASVFGTITAAGAGDEVFAGSGAATFGAIVSAGSGTEVFAGAGASTFGGITAAGSGGESFDGTGASVFGTITAAGSGNEIFAGSGTGTLAFAAAGSGDVFLATVDGSGTGTIGFTAAGSGTAPPSDSGGGGGKPRRGWLINVDDDDPPKPRKARRRAKAAFVAATEPGTGDVIVGVGAASFPAFQATGDGVGALTQGAGAAVAIRFRADGRGDVIVDDDAEVLYLLNMLLNLP